MIKNLLPFAPGLVLLFTCTVSAASRHHSHHHSGHDHTRPDSHAPIGVMGDHLMREGEIMVSYRYMHMDMEGNRTGTERVDVPLPG